ncbi:hypothetical protein [Cyanobium sp. NIES-981]|uniref:hypothetical protein n=1 Tax=Cyanobium sp. NIES-981 TaxID=1851505 RepID=UPI0007DDEDE8|nr:hypothetical protein [Cyanobium sp. NIES-981]SBO42793.1 conserved protein of unknown function [Cyanobium sp. NIES-981]
MTSSRRPLLQLPMNASQSRKAFRRRRLPSRLRQFSTGVLLGSLGSGVLVALMQIPERLNTFLLLSKAIANLIGGLQEFLLGLVQLLAVVLLVAVALAALVLIVAGVVRLVRACLPRPRSQGKS